MERELSKNMRKEKFGGGYYYRFCDDIEKNSEEEILGKIREEMERVTNPPRYDMGLSCGLTYNEERKIFKYVSDKHYNMLNDLLEESKSK